MSLKVGSKIFYPSHGAGWIKREKDIEFGGEKKRYYEIELVTNPLSISTPVERIEALGVRKVLPKKEILDMISELKKKPTKKTNSSDFNTMLKMFKDLEENSSMESSIEIIQYCNYVKQKREKEGRLIPVSIEKQLEGAIKNIVGELAVSAGTTLKTANKTFTKTTGIEADIEV
jgi:RNA polymerase-interacting CarD/CdnL/TRCF family regulator